MRNLLLALPLATLTAACGGEPLAPETPSVADEATGQAAQQVTLDGTYTWRVNEIAFTSSAIGSATNRTCFLSALGGSLQENPSNDGVRSFAGVNISDDRWLIVVRQNADAALSTTARCVNTAANRTAEVSWSNGEAAKVLGAVTADRRCFLTRVEASGAFNSTSEYVRVWNDGLNWYLGGDLADAGGARAICVDIPESVGNGWQLISGSGGQSTDLAYNPGGVACFLSGIGGRFNQDSYSDGVSVDYNSGTLTWEMALSPFKRGWAHCVK
ncbi:hypothetical protein MYSTI_06824 [Myxococcus stipitatus DSM 14675]|uniref:Lipoprotein n=1 Tax=Myxococcus stipitatus (strain DSM 14675 / JCM 12634 / Mx s8) TaxID=1278073 RepID=L7UKM9_MYXSD|nr:hypothetical protein [Myxococcus stipitatus]AGC48097.1 hypothetical protein MYSTI_06824 [Myxococcus stipitatus DSM 14675]